VRDISGTWKLVKETANDSAGRPAALVYEGIPVGSATFTAEGRVVAVLSDGRIEGAPVTPPLTAFCGRYTFDGTQLVMHLDYATRPTMMTEPQVRIARFEDDAMVLTATAHDGLTRSFTWCVLG
jgi:hypothetical protein